MNSLGLSETELWEVLNQARENEKTLRRAATVLGLLPAGAKGTPLVPLEKVSTAVESLAVSLVS